MVGLDAFPLDCDALVSVACMRACVCVCACVCV